MRSFGYRMRKVFRLDGWNGLDRYQVHCRVVQVYHRRSKLWNLGRRSLVSLLPLRASTTWKVTKVHRIGYALPLPRLDDSFLDDQRSCIVLDLDVLFTFSTTGNSLLLVFLYGGQPYGEEDNVKKKKKKEWTILTSMSGLLISKIFSSRLKTKSLSSQKTKSHQAMENPLREGINSIYML